MLQVVACMRRRWLAMPVPWRACWVGVEWCHGRWYVTPANDVKYRRTSDYEMTRTQKLCIIIDMACDTHTVPILCYAFQ